MEIDSFQIVNFKSFADSGLIKLGKINVLVGRNNSGKSTVLQALMLMQHSADARNTDIRIGRTNGKVEVQFKSDNLRLDLIRYFGRKIERYDGVYRARFERAESPNNIGLDVQRSYAVDHAHAQFSLDPLAQQEPWNFIYPYLARRKVTSYDEQVGRQRTLAVSSNLQNLTAKVLRLSNPSYQGHEEYNQLCHEVLGFRVGAFAVDNGHKAGLTIGKYHEIPIESMGEGVPSALGLIANLCMADGHLFLIEEPENDLHPEALKALLRAIIKKSSDNQFVITTHSNVVVKNLGPDSHLFTVDLQFEPGRVAVPTSTIRPVENTAPARIEILRQLGYELYDSDLHDGWLFLEESSAQVIIRNYLIPWFVPRLSRIQTVSTKGVDRTRLVFEEFHRLFLFAHLESQYHGRAWVIIDGDTLGHEVAQLLRESYPTWPEEHFCTWTKKNFEEYYPVHFKERVAAVLALPHAEKRDAKKPLLEDVKAWCESDEEEAKAALAESASEVIDFLREIDALLFGSAC